MSECPWEEIDAFQSPGEFWRFEAWLVRQMQTGEAEQVEAKAAMPMLRLLASDGFGTRLQARRGD